MARVKVQGGVLDTNTGTFFRRVADNSDVGEKLVRQEGTFRLGTGGDPSSDVGSFRTAVKVEEPKPKPRPAAPATNPAAEREAARAQAEAAAAAAEERRRGIAERERLDRERVAQSADRERPVTRGGTAPTRRPRPQAVQEAVREGASLLGAALVREEERGRQLVTGRRGRGTVLGIT